MADLAADGTIRIELRYGAAGRPEHLYSGSGENGEDTEPGPG
ncbi:hypothetical protein [Streptomyces sp. Ru72]|nr:hypothetical protein [Streptomyces sp. Ru72]